MQTYVLRRRGIAAGANELDAAFTRLRAFDDGPAAAAPALLGRWLHSCALREADGRLGLLCVFQAADGDVLRRHAELTRLPAEEVLPVAATLLLRAFAPARVFLVRRRGFWRSATELERSAAVARRIADEEMATRVCWLHSYVVRESDGALGSVCFFQGLDAQALREHAARAGLPVDEITPVMGRVPGRIEAPQQRISH